MRTQTLNFVMSDLLGIFSNISVILKAHEILKLALKNRVVLAQAVGQVPHLSCCLNVNSLSKTLNSIQPHLLECSVHIKSR